MTLLGYCLTINSLFQYIPSLSFLIRELSTYSVHYNPPNNYLCHAILPLPFVECLADYIETKYYNGETLTAGILHRTKNAIQHQMYIIHDTVWRYIAASDRKNITHRTLSQVA